MGKRLGEPKIVLHCTRRERASAGRRATDALQDRRLRRRRAVPAAEAAERGSRPSRPRPAAARARRGRAAGSGTELALSSSSRRLAASVVSVGSSVRRRAVSVVSVGSSLRDRRVGIVRRRRIGRGRRCGSPRIRFCSARLMSSFGARVVAHVARQRLDRVVVAVERRRCRRRGRRRTSRRSPAGRRTWRRAAGAGEREHRDAAGAGRASATRTGRRVWGVDTVLGSGESPALQAIVESLPDGIDRPGEHSGKRFVRLPGYGRGHPPRAMVAWPAMRWPGVSVSVATALLLAALFAGDSVRTRRSPRSPSPAAGARSRSPAVRRCRAAGGVAARGRRRARALDGTLRRLVDRARPLLGRAEPQARLRRLPRARAPARRGGGAASLQARRRGARRRARRRRALGAGRARRSRRSSRTAAAPPGCATRSATGTRSRSLPTCCSSSRSGSRRRRGSRARPSRAARCSRTQPSSPSLLTASRAGVAGGGARRRALALAAPRAGRGGAARARGGRCLRSRSPSWAFAGRRSSRTGSRAPTGVADGAWFGLLLVVGAALAAVVALELASPAARAVRAAHDRPCARGLAVARRCRRRDRGRRPARAASQRSSGAARSRTTRAGSASLSSNNRLAWWRRRGDIFEAEPLGGAGANTFEIARKRYREIARP